ncbi:MAG: uroporphyrinogen decarboxylase family protein [Phycisphaerae bacterium]|nr:uroporphyrinogen decarboxylase family protein [Phycisphaerae bacterium]
MNERERFVAVCRGQQPDYVPIFGFPGAPGMSGGALKWTHRRLQETGMPDWVGGACVDWKSEDIESWYRYWGTAGPLHLDFGLARGARGIGSTTRIEGGYEIIEYESGAIERQVIDNANIYIMPEYVRYAVRDRASWEFWRDRSTPAAIMPPDEMEANCRRFDGRTKPLFIGLSGAYGFLRGLLGPEGLSVMFYDDPELIHDMCRWHTERVRRYALPLVERLKPECAYMGEDLCYNHGMLLSPKLFDEFCAPHYRAVCGCARAAEVPAIAVDSDGNIMEYADVAAKYGVTCLYPSEVKAGNDLFALRRKHPALTLVGWLEKEIINEGNEHMIEPELAAKVPALLKAGRYFPNGDHGIQPGVTFASLCRFMTLLHEMCNNPEGEFPRTNRAQGVQR